MNLNIITERVPVCDSILKYKESFVENCGPKAINFSQFIFLESQQVSINWNSGLLDKFTLQSIEP